MTDYLLPVVCLLGPTASGKTGLAIELREKFGFDVISVDSALVYKRMDIGTAKPDEKTLIQTPHALIDLIEPWESYSVSRFMEDVQVEINRTHANGRVPLLVGGTMMYFHALWHGLSKLPPADSRVRQALKTELSEKGSDNLHLRLQSVDPVAASRIDANDPQRLMRALEVYQLTGKPMTQLQNVRAGAGNYDFYNVGYFPQERSVLHKNIQKRFTDMLELGFLDEVRELLKEPPMSVDLPSMRCVGYRQACTFLCNKITLDEMSTQAVAATRQLAKRQLTWMRKMNQINLFDLSLSLEQLIAEESFRKWCGHHRIAT